MKKSKVLKIFAGIPIGILVFFILNCIIFAIFDNTAIQIILFISSFFISYKLSKKITNKLFKAETTNISSTSTIDAVDKNDTIKKENKELGVNELADELIKYINTGKESKKLKEHKKAMKEIESNAKKEKAIFQQYFAMYEEARKLEKQSKPDEALKIYLNILDKYTPDGSAYYERPRIILERQGRYDEAINICQCAIDAINNGNLNGEVDEFEHSINRLLKKKSKPKDTSDSKKSNVKPKSNDSNLPDLKNIPALHQDSKLDILNTKWYIMISFGKSTSKSYEKAVYLAKNSPKYDELIDDKGNVTHTATYTDSKEDFLDFIILYDLVSNWKSTFFIINGEIIDKKTVGKIKYCYGDKCRSVKSDFCYGASYMTANPFGCHRLQISQFNNPWWEHYVLEGNHYRLDRDRLIERIKLAEETFRYCPSFDTENIMNVAMSFPLILKKKEYEEIVSKETNVYL